MLLLFTLLYLTNPDGLFDYLYCDSSTSDSSSYSSYSESSNSNSNSPVYSIPEEEVPIPSHFSDWGTSSESTSQNSESQLVRSTGSINLLELGKEGMLPKSSSCNFTSSTVKEELIPKNYSDNYFNKK